MFVTCNGRQQYMWRSATLSSSTARDSRSWARVNGPLRNMEDGGRRGWKKLHLGVDRSGVVVARALTEASVDDATSGITLGTAVDGAPRTGDGGCRLRYDRLLCGRRCA